MRSTYPLPVDETLAKELARGTEESEKDVEFKLIMAYHYANGFLQNYNRREIPENKKE